MKKINYFLLAMLGIAGFAAGVNAQDSSPEPVIVP